MQLERNTKLKRSFAISQSEYNQETNEIAISFSSEQPVLRDFGYEVLKHTRSAINDERIVGGLPLLWNHNRDQQIGRANGITLDMASKKLRAVVKFSRNEFPQSILRDIQDGIVTDVSFGYMVDDFEVDQSNRSQDGVPTYNVTRWTPFEVSFVTIPADITVGVGRAMGCEDPKMEMKADPDAAQEEDEQDGGADDAIEKVEEKALDAVDGDDDSEVTEPDTEKESETQDKRNLGLGENAQTIISTSTQKVETTSLQRKSNMENSTRQETLAIMGLATKLGLASEASEMLASERSIEQVKSDLLALAATKQPKVSAEPHIDARDLKGYSIGKAIRAQLTNDWSEAGLEREASKFLSRKLNREASGFFVPTSAFRAANTMNTGGTGQGKELVFNEYAGFIDLLRPSSKVIQLGAQVFGGLTNNLTFVQETAAPVTYWVGENSGADVTDTKIGTTQKTLSPKQLMAQLSYTRTQLMQSVEAMDSLIMARLVREHAIAIDAAAIGYKSTVTNAPTGGILLDSGVPVTALATNGQAITNSASVAAVFGLKTVVNKNNALSDACAYLTTPDMQGKLEITAVPGATVAQAAWAFDKLNGFKAVSSANVPANLDKGTSTGVCHPVIFGDFSNLIVGDFGALDITVDPYTLGGQGLTRILSNQLADIGITRPTAFAVIKDALNS